MKKLLLALALWPGVAHAQASAQNSAKCDALIQEAKVESALLKSPSAIARLGNVDTSQQNVVGGISYSISDRRRGKLVDRRALIECEEAAAKDALLAYLRYAKVEEEQQQARAETALLRGQLGWIDDQAGRMRELLAANLITIADYEEFSLMSEMIRSRISHNEVILSRDNAFDGSLDLTAATGRLQDATRRLAAITQKIRTASAWSLDTQAGVRAPIERKSEVAPFAALNLRYSFGKGASERAARLATDHVVAAMGDDISSVLRHVQEARVAYAREAALVERSEIPLAADRIREYDRLLATTQGIETGRAQLIRAQAKARKIYSEALLAGLRARADFMKRQSAPPQDRATP